MATTAHPKLPKSVADAIDPRVHLSWALDYIAAKCSTARTKCDDESSETELEIYGGATLQGNHARYYVDATLRDGNVVYSLRRHWLEKPNCSRSEIMAFFQRVPIYMIEQPPHHRWCYHRLCIFFSDPDHEPTSYAATLEAGARRCLLKIVRHFWFKKAQRDWQIQLGLVTEVGSCLGSDQKVGQKRRSDSPQLSPKRICLSY